MKRVAWLLLPLLGLAGLRAQDDLPRKAPGDTVDFEPKLMLDGPQAAPVAEASPVATEERVKELEGDLVRAEGRAADAEQLYKEGILAKVEEEDRMLRVVKAEKELDDAKLAAAADRAAAVKKSFDAHQTGKSDLDAANAALKNAQDAAATAAAAWEQGQIDAAALDLKRKRKLYEEGVGSKREVEIAEDHLALISGTIPK